MTYSARPQSLKLTSEAKDAPLMLQVTDLSAAYGCIVALRNISLSVKQGELVTLIGSNGAGKTSLLRTVAGTLKPREGRVLFEGKEIARLLPHQIMQKGISLVQEGREIFTRLKVEDNLRVGAYSRKNKSEIQEDMRWMYERFPILMKRRSQLAGTLSGGEQQMLAIARGLMSRPKLMLLDEPSLGLAPLVIHNIFEIISDLKNEGITVLLVEQNARLALKTADRAYLLECGEIVMKGDSAEMLKNPRVQEAYIGSNDCGYKMKPNYH